MKRLSLVCRSVSNLMKSPVDFCGWQDAATRHSRAYGEEPQRCQTRKDPSNSQDYLRNGTLVALASFAVLLLSGCGMGTKLQPPTASIQQLQVQNDGTWIATVRIENYSYDTGMHVYAVDADLDIGGKRAGHIAISPALDIPAMSADTATATFTPAAEARAALTAAKNNAVAYQLKGGMSIGKGDNGKPDHFDLDGKGYLSPVPGVANIWR